MSSSIKVWTNSVFIPFVPKTTTKADLRRELESAYDVVVDRIDMNNNVQKGCIQAFIHFSVWNEADFKTKNLKDLLMNQETPFVWKVFGYKLFMFVNHKPIPTPEQNEHQISASLTICRELIDDQQLVITQMVAQISEQNRMMDQMRQEIGQQNVYIQTLFQMQPR